MTKRKRERREKYLTIEGLLSYLASREWGCSNNIFYVIDRPPLFLFEEEKNLIIQRYSDGNSGCFIDAQGAIRFYGKIVADILERKPKPNERFYIPGKTFLGEVYTGYYITIGTVISKINEFIKDTSAFALFSNYFALEQQRSEDCRIIKPVEIVIEDASQNISKLFQSNNVVVNVSSSSSSSSSSTSSALNAAKLLAMQYVNNYKPNSGHTNSSSFSSQGSSSSYSSSSDYSPYSGSNCTYSISSCTTCSTVYPYDGVHPHSSSFSQYSSSPVTSYHNQSGDNIESSNAVVPLIPSNTPFSPTQLFVFSPSTSSSSISERSSGSQSSSVQASTCGPVEPQRTLSNNSLISNNSNNSGYPHVTIGANDIFVSPKSSPTSSNRAPVASTSSAFKFNMTPYSPN